jgi:hypothetical protein
MKNQSTKMWWECIWEIIESLKDNTQNTLHLLVLI